MDLATLLDFQWIGDVAIIFIMSVPTMIMIACQMKTALIKKMDTGIGFTKKLLCIKTENVWFGASFTVTNFMN